MIKTIKLIAFALAISFPFVLVSCLGSNDVPERTSEMEQQELSQALANLEKAGYNIDTTELGVFYVMNKIGNGTFPAAGDTCSLIYTGYFLDGTIFDSSGDYYKDSIWQINYKEVSLIPGFNDGIALLNKGAEADIIIPSKFGYGATGNGSIAPYTPLIFTLKMRNLKPVIQK